MVLSLRTFKSHEKLVLWGYGGYGTSDIDIFENNQIGQEIIKNYEKEHVFNKRPPNRLLNKINYVRLSIASANQNIASMSTNDDQMVLGNRKFNSGQRISH